MSYMLIWWLEGEEDEEVVENTEDTEVTSLDNSRTELSRTTAVDAIWWI